MIKIRFETYDRKPYGNPEYFKDPSISVEATLELTTFDEMIDPLKGMFVIMGWSKETIDEYIYNEDELEDFVKDVIKTQEEEAADIKAFDEKYGEEMKQRLEGEPPSINKERKDEEDKLYPKDK